MPESPWLSSLLVMVLGLFPVVRGAEFCSPPDGQPRHDFQFFAGYSPAPATLIGTATGRRFVAAGFSYGYRCWIWRSASLSYTATTMPAAILLQPSEVVFVAGNRERFRPSHAVYGFGVAPLGFTLDIGHARKLDPFVETIEGVIASTEPIPENQPNASGLNFFFALGGGIRWKTARRTALRFGYRFLHISNAETTNFNPRVDNNVFYVGYSFLR